MIHIYTSKASSQEVLSQQLRSRFEEKLKREQREKTKNLPLDAIALRLGAIARH